MNEDVVEIDEEERRAFERALEREGYISFSSAA